MRILIGYDGSQCADAAIQDLKQAGLPDSADAVVITVAEAWLPPPPMSSYEIVDSAAARVAVPNEKARRWQVEAAETARKIAEEAASRVSALFPNWQMNADGCFGSPSTELISKAEAGKADLIVVGSHGRSAFGRLILGSVSNRVLTEARCSVRVARGASEAKAGPVKILACVDGSPGSYAAVASIANRKWPSGTQARVLIVCDPITPTAVGSLLPPVAQWTTDFNEEQKANAEQTIAPAVDRLRDAGLTVEGLVKAGDPRWIVLNEAEEWKADSIFVGARGLSRVERFLLGSVSSAVAARAHCSVEVVRAT